mmetsp:Transcript_52003/g.105969  ORF Transcript_52003/g.105969 Transcript_52003/m.105969 type:complete len:428 (-) Transcript_52003:371-1654(-)
MEALPVGLAVRHSLLLLLDLSEEVLCLLVERGHDVRHAQVCEHHRRHLQQLLLVALDKGLVVPDRLVELVLLHEEDVRDVELPHIVLATKLRTLAEDLLDHGVVLEVPVDARHCHQHRDVPLQRLVVVLEALLDRLVIARDAGVLDLLGELAQHVDVLVRQPVELVVRLRGRRLEEDGGVEEAVEVRGEVLVGERGVVCHHVRRKVVVLVFAVEEEEVAEGLGGEGGLADEPVHLLEACRRVLLHVHQRQIVQRHRVELLLRTGGHVSESLLGRSEVFHHILDRGLEVERLDQGRLLEHDRVPNRSHVDALGVGADRELRVLAHPPFDDVGDVFHCGAVLLEAVETERDVVRQLRLVAEDIHCLCKFVLGPLVITLLVQHRPEPHDCVRIIWKTLIKVRFTSHQVILFVFNGSLQIQDPLPVAVVVD